MITSNTAKKLTPFQTMVNQYIPFIKRLNTYQRADFINDVLAAIIVAIMLVPQGMAYAMLAGLPPQVGLYASILPLIIYGLLGSSRSLAVGPVAIVSLLVATGLNPLAQAGSAEYVQLALTLALLVGIIQLGMGLIKIGFLVNFLSHPVISGFSSAAAIIIGFSQVKHLLGFSVPRTEYFYEQVVYTFQHLQQTNFITLGIGIGGVVILLYFKRGLEGHLRPFKVLRPHLIPITKSAPLVIVVVGTLLVIVFNLNEVADVAIIGTVPAGLPPITMPDFKLNTWQLLLPTALAISFVGYMESISVAKSLASKRRQKIDANQELLALGGANLAAMLTGGYPVTGGFSRSIVNFSAGANSGLASIMTALLIAITVIFLTPLFYFLPNAMLAAIIIVAVFNLIDFAMLKHMWQYNKADAASLLITFGAVLGIGIEQGILAGAIISIGLFLWRTSRPHYAIVGRLGETEHYRNILRHPVKTCPHVTAIRVDESLYFANTKFLEDTILSLVANKPEIKHLVLIGAAVNFIDASALETLESLHHELKDGGVAFYLSDIKGPVMDRLEAIGFVDKIGKDHIFLSIHKAMETLECT